MRCKTAIIVGAGPAGLTAALELLRTTDIKPVVIEAGDSVGGLSRTVAVNGQRLDIGGHRFFSKSKRVMAWWQQIMPLQPQGAPPSPEQLLRRARLSRILFEGKLYDYPLRLTPATLWQLGPRRCVRMLISYLAAQLRRSPPPDNLEQFFIQRFGTELYRCFFQSYTEKVWGLRCDQIAADWGAQRIRGLSITALLRHALIPARWRRQTETSLIDSFLYPARGPGQLWEEVAQQVRELGGEILLNHRLEQLDHDRQRITAAHVRAPGGDLQKLFCDALLSSMPVCDLIASLSPAAPKPIQATASALPYRHFYTVGLLLARDRIHSDCLLQPETPDNWIYIQERGLKLGRLQLFHNWSRYLCADNDRYLWIGLEYFCNEQDPDWQLSDAALIQQAVEEATGARLINAGSVVQSALVRAPKAYPTYAGTYRHFASIRDYTDAFSNLYLIGRNGMHRYNNQDHSMLAAMEAVALIREGSLDKQRLWSIGADDEYLEEQN